jgi:hypothetical protein
MVLVTFASSPEFAVSRAFVNEDGPEGPPPLYSLPPRDAAAYPLAAARALLVGANAGDTASAEAATGYFWGDPTLRAEMNQLADEAMDRGDDRMDQLARRFLRAAGAPREDS